MSRLARSLFTLGLAVAVVACGDDDKTVAPSGTPAPTPSGTTTPTGDPLAQAGPVVEQYAKNVYANYMDCLTTAKALKTAVDAFVKTPTAASQKAAQDAWITARKPYGPSEVYRFYDGPIDNKDGPEGELNSWPLDENFIDYTRDAPTAGIINDPSIKLTKELLKSKNTDGGEKNISVGWHAIEFLLWGQDDPDPMKRTAGQRKPEDYTTAKNADRRKQYLTIVTDLLVEDIQILVDAWAPGKDNYAKTFVADPKAAVKNIITGMGSLSNAELSGERMSVAYKNKDQEDEHSCFSDTTAADLQGNFLGLQNVYLGKYGASSGMGLGVLVAAADPALDAQLKADLDAGVAAFAAMQSERFDIAITSDDSTPARANVLKAIQAVKKVAADVTQVAAKLGVTVKLEEPSVQL